MIIIQSRNRHEKAASEENPQNRPIHTFFFSENVRTWIGEVPRYPHTSGEAGGYGEKPSTGEWGASFCVVVIRSSTYSRRQPERWRTQLGNDVSGPRVSGHKASITRSPRTRNGRRHRRSGTRCGSEFCIGMRVTSCVNGRRDRGIRIQGYFFRHHDDNSIPLRMIQSLPRRRCLPGQSTSGCTTRMCRVRASLRLKVFSSVHKWHRTFSLRALWIVSS